MTCTYCIDTMYHPGTPVVDCDCSCHVIDIVTGVADGWVSMPRPEPDQRKAAAAQATHHFDTEEGRCWDCDRRIGGGAANYPCGERVPRVVVRVQDQNAAFAPLMRGVAIADTLKGIANG